MKPINSITKCQIISGSSIPELFIPFFQSTHAIKRKHFSLFFLSPRSSRAQNYANRALVSVRLDSIYGSGRARSQPLSLSRRSREHWTPPASSLWAVMQRQKRGGEERERFILENDWVHIKFDFFFSVIFFFFIHSDRGNLHQLSFGHLISQNKVQRDNLRSESFKRRIIFSYVTDLWRHSWLLLTCIKL